MKSDKDITTIKKWSFFRHSVLQY